LRRLINDEILDRIIEAGDDELFKLLNILKREFAGRGYDLFYVLVNKKSE